MKFNEQLGAVFDRAVINKKFSSLLCFIAGIIATIPYYIEWLFVCTFLSLILLFRVVIKEKQEQKRIFSPFFWYYTGHYVFLYLFLSEMYPFSRFGFNSNQAIFILICSCVAIPLLHAVVSASIMIISRFFRTRYISVLGFASLFVIIEWVMSLGTLAFPWGSISVSLIGCLPYLQTASLFGKYFITFITVAGCYFIADSNIEKERKYAVFGVVIIISNLLIGLLLWYIPPEKSNNVNTAVIQGNVLSNEKWERENASTIFNRYVDMTEKAAIDGSKVILLPESAIPITFLEGGKLHSTFAEIASEYDCTIILGVHYFEPTTKEYFNSVIAVYPDGTLSERYDKRHLVPFGEFIPFVDTIGKMFPFVAEFSNDTSTLTEGYESVIISTEYGDFAPLVCFDSIFPKFAKEAVDDGADYIAVVTNDSWFNDSAGIFTHLRHAQLRAIENKRYVIRAANTGVSSIINERGQLIVKTQPLTPDKVDLDVYTISTKTLYSSIGDIFLYISFSIIIFAIIYFIRSYFYGNHSASSNRDL